MCSGSLAPEKQLARRTLLRKLQKTRMKRVFLFKAGERGEDGSTLVVNRCMTLP